MGRLVSILAPIGSLSCPHRRAWWLNGDQARNAEKADEARAGPQRLPPNPSIATDLHLTGRKRQAKCAAAGREINCRRRFSGRVRLCSAPDLQSMGGFIKKGQLLVRVEAADYELRRPCGTVGVAKAAEHALARELAEAELAVRQSRISVLRTHRPSPAANRSSPRPCPALERRQGAN